MTDYTSSRLRYVDADKLDTRVLDLDGLDVRNSREDHIGDVEGLLIDSVSGRPRYLVIDSGGWFRSRRFLLPIAHARLDENRRTLRVDFDKETINRFPEMRSDRYEALTDEELQRYDEGVWRSSGDTRPTAVDTRNTTDSNRHCAPRPRPPSRTGSSRRRGRRSSGQSSGWRSRVRCRRHR